MLVIVPLSFLIFFSYSHTAVGFLRRNPATSKVHQNRASLEVFAYPEQFVYNGEEIEKYYDRRPFEVWERLVDIGSPVLGWWLLRKYENITASFRSDEENQAILNNRAKDLKDSIVQGKSVTFIKSGQALALRPDIVKSPEYIRELQTLQDEVGTFDNNVAMKIISDELGADAHEIYEFNPPIPIASASIGQVYKAKVRATNESVAVKVQRPDAIATVGIDMYILRKIAAYIKKRRKFRSNLPGIVDEFGNQLFNELNYVQEGKNCERFKELYGEIPGIYVPSVNFDLTTQRVLTMEFVEGEKGPWAEGGERLLTVGLQCSVLQLLGTGFFHSDPHRGNLLKTPSGKLAYLDFGMMAEVPAEKRYAMIGSVLGLVNKDISMVINNIAKLDFFPAGTDTDQIIGSLNSAISNATVAGQASTLNFTLLNQNLQSISGQLPFRLPPYYTLIIRSLTILEGLALFVDPSFKLVQGAYPFIAKQILAEPSREMNELLRTLLLTEDDRIRWDKLEQFISISSNADKAMAGDFQALKTAQDRASVMQAYKNVDKPEESGSTEARTKATTTEQDNFNVTLSLASQMVDYLLSDNGRYLRDPLVEEVVDTLEALGLTAQSVMSVVTNRLLPAPKELPDRQRVLRVLNIFNSLAEGGRQQLEKRLVETAGVNDGYFHEIDGRKSGIERLEQIFRVFNALNMLIINQIQTLSRTQQNQQLAELVEVLTKGSFLFIQVAEKLAERTTKRIVKDIFSPDRVQSTIPPLLRILDLLPK